MSRTVENSSPALGIRIDGNRTRFAPGDIVSGWVYRSEHVVSPEASVRIALNGRAESKVSRGGIGFNSDSMIDLSDAFIDDAYRGRYNFFNKAETTRMLHHGPIHVAEGEEQTWPFSIAIPTRIDPGSLQAKVVPKEQSYLSIDPKDIATQALPPTFDFDKKSITRDVDGFVEYCLQATLHFPGPRDDEFASLPISLPMLSDQPPIIDFRPCKTSARKALTSPRLVPGTEKADLSFSQKASKLFRSSNAPSFFFRVDTGLPQVVQLNNPNPIPIRIRVAPEWEQTSDALRKHPPKVKLTSIWLEVVAHTEVLCDGNLMPTKGTRQSEQNLKADELLAALGEEVFVPCTNDFELLDVGELIGLRLGYYEISSNYFRGRFRPSFKTYNINYWHKLHWRMKLDIAGEGFLVSGTQDVTLLAPSIANMGIKRRDPGVESVAGSLMAPPSVSDHLPSFAESQKTESNLGKEGFDGGVKGL